MSMNAIREVVYECWYASSAQQRTAHVRAWDLREAVELFAQELRLEGVAEDGRICARAFGASGAGDVSEVAYPLR